MGKLTRLVQTVADRAKNAPQAGATSVPARTAAVNAVASTFFKRRKGVYI